MIDVLEVADQIKKTAIWNSKAACINNAINLKDIMKFVI